MVSENGNQIWTHEMTPKLNDEILMESGVSFQTLKPFVKLHWGEMRCQMDPEEARQHALSIIECAESAEQDAYLVWFMHEIVKAPIEKVAMMLGEFRSKRANFGNRKP